MVYVFESDAAGGDALEVIAWQQRATELVRARWVQVRASWCCTYPLDPNLIIYVHSSIWLRVGCPSRTGWSLNGAYPIHFKSDRFTVLETRALVNLLAPTARCA